MEYCEGGDLGKIIKKCNAKKKKEHFQEEIIWKFAYQIFEALKVCHKDKILHRDLKPVNIFLDGDLNVKLGDFGLSKKLIEGKSFASTNVGSPYYMSPELFLNVPYDEKIDIWSAGCIIYEMAALEQPFKASSIGELGEKIKLGVFKRIN